MCADLSTDDWVAVHTAATETLCSSYAAQAALAAAAGAGVSITRGTFAAMEPRFRLLAYSQEQAGGLPVRRDEGPHGRSVFWVPLRQVRGKGADRAGAQPARDELGAAATERREALPTPALAHGTRDTGSTNVTP